MLDLSKVKLLKGAADLVGKGMRFAKAKSPEIFLVAGIGMIVGGVVYACKKSMDVKEAKDELDEHIDEIEATVEVDDGYEGDLAVEGERKKAVREFVIETAKAYALPAGLIFGGIGLIVAGHTVQARRLAAVNAMYNGLLTTFTEYRRKVIDDHGLEADQRYLSGSKKVLVEKTKTGKNGKEKTVEQEISVVGSDGEMLYHRLFDDASREWCKDPQYNFEFLTMAQRVMNDKFQARGYLFLDEVCDMLDLSIEGKYAKSKMVGWSREQGAEYVDFGIYHPMFIDGKYINKNEGFTSGYEPSIWLNFNCSGILIGEI